MASEPILATLEVAAVPPRHGLARSGVLSAYWTLTKPDVNFLIAFTTAAGFWMGAPASIAHFLWASLLHALIGTVLVASGAASLNQLIELRFDAQMRRTARRPLVSRRIGRSQALWFGISLSVVGTVYLAVTTNVLTSLLSISTLLGYLFLYTPLKRMTPLCTLIGALPGATPPLMGWAAASGHINGNAWQLFAIVFFWQFPHFMAIAWMYREDYARAGYVVLPAGELKNRFVSWQTLLPSLALFAVALVPVIRGEFGIVYLAGALVLGTVFLCYSVRFALKMSIVSARRLLLASIVYLPLLLALLALGKK